MALIRSTGLNGTQSAPRSPVRGRVVEGKEGPKQKWRTTLNESAER
jgi:hypothetical protein